MDESKGRGVFARRQQPTTPVHQRLEPPSSPQRKSKRKVSNFMLGVAAGLAARKNNGVIQSPAQEIPRHLDFSYRDRADVTAKRRFQVKVPLRLMVILALVFLLIPGMIFIHKELHIHEDQYTSHFKGENYANVNTKDVWDNFKQATTTDDTKHDEVQVNTTVVNHKSHDSHSGDRTSSLQHNHTVAKSVVSKNETKPLATTMQDEQNGEADDGDTNSDEESPPEKENAEAVYEEEHKGQPPGDTMVEGNDNQMNDEKTKNLGTSANSTASNNIPDR